MTTEQLIFSTWKQRCSSLGYILTCLPEGFTDEDEKTLEDILKEKETGINAAGNKTRGWSPTKQEQLDKLLIKKEGKDILPPGCITHLEDIFRSQFWGRKRLVYNKYLEKGIMVEEDALALLSLIDNAFYIKNDEQFQNDFIQGCPDNIEKDKNIGRDTKSNYDMDTFDKAELTPLYEAQLKGYGFLTGITNWELCYCLVNTPLHRIEAERKTLWYAMSMPEDNDPRWVEAVLQLERNMIFDMSAFKREFPGADLMHGKLIEFADGSFRSYDWNHDVPAKFRVKRFNITLETSDIEHIKRRIEMCREWLINKERETLQLLNS